MEHLISFPALGLEFTLNRVACNVFGKDIYIIGNTYGMSEFYADTFFKPYDPEKKAEGTDVIFIESITDVPAEEVRDGHALVLIEVPEENAYRDITEDLK